ncbi:DUF6247 family protein [Kibdelosporangium aridum]|uniref:DUF6247 family protein n=1 Tax=Kibdelosporangium aridum TaxID=2030 RepID=UPI000527B277
MTLSAAQQFPTEPPGTTPRAIRAALLPEEAADFDRDYRAALRTAAETLSLDELHATLTHWHRVARMTQADPEAHRRMLQRAEETLRTGEEPADVVAADDVKALIRERLGL